MKTINRTLRSLLACFFLTVLSVSCSSSDDVSEENTSIDVAIFNSVNKHRSSLKLKAYTTNAFASSLAQEHSAYMAAQKKLSYDNYDQRASTLIKEENPTKIAESVANKYDTAEELLDAMLNDTGHKKNLEDDYTDIGIGAQKDDSGVYYYTFIFLKK